MPHTSTSPLSTTPSIWRWSVPRAPSRVPVPLPRGVWLVVGVAVVRALLRLMLPLPCASAVALGMSVAVAPEQGLDLVGLERRALGQQQRCGAGHDRGGLRGAAAAEEAVADGAGGGVVPSPARAG